MANNLLRTLGAIGACLTLNGCFPSATDESITQPKPAEVTTNEIAKLGIRESGYVSLVYFDNQNRLQTYNNWSSTSQITRDLPDGKQPLLIYQSNKPQIHIASNAFLRTHLSNSSWGFEVITPSSADSLENVAVEAE